MHDNIFSKVLACPMKFFDTTPIGRIINRFAADMDESKFLHAYIPRLLIVLYFENKKYDKIFFKIISMH
jgi:ABC-type multidrug transport system fused ATPase/permease subunit